MRQISAQLLDHDSLAELESGHRLELVQGGRTIAEIVPIGTTPEESGLTEQKRHQAFRRLKEIMDQGIDLGGLRISNRDELYERD